MENTEKSRIEIVKIKLKIKNEDGKKSRLWLMNRMP